MKSKTRFNKFIAFMLSFIFLFTTVVQPVGAAGDTYYYTGGGISGYNVAGSGTKLFEVKKTGSSDTYAAYCIDKTVTINTSSLYKIELLEDITYFSDSAAASIRGVVLGTYPNKTMAELRTASGISGLTKEQAITATQAVIWNHSNAANISSSAFGGNTKSFFEYLSGLSQVNVPITLEAIGPTVDMSDPNYVFVTYKYKTTGISATDITKTYNFTDEGTPVVTPDGDYTKVTVKIARTNFSYDTDYTITLNGSKILYDAFVFTPIEGQAASQTLVSAGHEEMVTENKVLTFNIAEPEYTFTFDPNFGTGVNVEQIFTAGGSVAGTTFTREGYTFAGWTTDEIGETAYTGGLSDLPAHDIYVFAQWSINEYDVLYDANGGTGTLYDSANPYDYNEEVTVLAPTDGTIARVGYTFIGWNTQANGTGVAHAVDGTFNMPASGVTLYAQWRIDSFQVLYHANGGTGTLYDSANPYDYNEEVTVLGPTDGTIARVGYTFMGWNTQANGNGVAHAVDGTFNMPASGVTLYAQWEAIDYSVTINYLDGDSNVLSAPYVDATMNIGNNYDVDSPMIPGYTTAQPNVSGTMPAADVVVNVIYEAIDYTFTFDPNHGAEVNVEQIFQVGGSVAGTAFTREGYNFVGWTTDMVGDTEYVGGLNDLPAHDIYVYAKWEAIDYTFTFDPNFGAEANVEQIFQVGGDVAGTTFIREGYTFAGWTTDEDGETAYTGGLVSLPAGDVYVYAQWNEVLPEEFVLTYVTNQPGLTIENVVFLEGDTIVAPAPTTEGFTFLGWFADETLETPFEEFNSMPANDVIVYADWGEVLGDEDGYEITFISNQPTITIPNVNYSEGEAIAEPKPTVDGYTFLGWYIDEAMTVKFELFNAMPGENVIVYASWGEVLGDEDQLPDTSDNSQSSGFGLLFLMLGVLAIVISKKEKEAKQ